MKTNLQILNILRVWCKKAHKGQAISKYESEGYVHDAGNVWDLFAQAIVSGRDIELCLPATTSRGGTLLERRLACFFKIALKKLKHNHPKIKAYKTFKTKENSDRTLRKELVEDFRTIMADQLGLKK